MRAYGVRLIAIEEARNYGKIVYIKNIFRNGWWDDMHTPYPTSLDPPQAISYKNHQKSLAYFNHLAPLLLFILLKDRVKRRDEVGGGGHNAPS